MNYYQNHELLRNNLTRRDVRVSVKAIIKFPIMCKHVCSVGVGLVLKVLSIQVNMVYYKFIFLSSCVGSQNVVTQGHHAFCSFRLLL